MKGRRRSCIASAMSVGLLVMVVVVLMALWLVLSMDNNPFLYQHEKQEYPSPTDGSSSPLPAAISVFSQQGYVTVNTNIDYNFTKLYIEWGIRHTALHNEISKKGLRGPSELNCFLWLLECYNLAKHPAIVKSLIPILGPDIVLHGIKLWKPTNETARRLQLDGQSGQCDEVANVVLGSNARILKGSQMSTGNLRHRLLSKIAALDTYQNHAHVEDIIVGTVRKGMLRKLGKRTEDFVFITTEARTGNAIIFHGKTLYRMETTVGEVSVVLQFASAKCKIREKTQIPFNVFLPPVLLISGSHNAILTPNDVRTVMASSEAFIFVPKTTQILSPFARVEQNFSLFSWKNLSTNCKAEEGYRTCSYGSASTAVLSRVSFEYSDSEVGGTGLGALVSDNEEKVVIVLRGSLLYYCAVEVPGYREMSVLDIHGSTYIPVGAWYALVPASPYKNAFVSVRWRSRKMVTRKAFPAIGGLFRFRTIVLQRGQAYDPSNENNCDVILVMLYGDSLQMLPSEIFLEESESLLISGSEPCLLWNIGKAPAAFVAIHVCGYDEQIDRLFNGDPNASAYYNDGGRIMRKS